jgi:2-polyprenyl-3-methyl-5-hydroxy-6-metoxy-1,4-benzoquinol methylase
MKCRICGDNELFLFYVEGHNDRFRYYKCRNCGLVNLDLDNLDQIVNQQQFADNFHPPIDHEKDKGSLTAYQFFTNYVPVKGRYMDIGCGDGSVLYFAKKNGWEVKGLELSPVFAEYAKKTLNIDVEVIDFLKYNDPQEKYDLVSLRHVLEHLPDSVLALTKISGMLKKNGYAHFEMPNINSLTHKFHRIRNKIPALKRKYNPDFVTSHCNQFSKQSFIYLLKKTGFSLVRWETYSSKPIPNFIYNHLHIGTKARAIVQKVDPK